MKFFLNNYIRLLLNFIFKNTLNTNLLVLE